MAHQSLVEGDGFAQYTYPLHEDLVILYNQVDQEQTSSDMHHSCMTEPLKYLKYFNNSIFIFKFTGSQPRNIFNTYTSSGSTLTATMSPTYKITMDSAHKNDVLSEWLQEYLLFNFACVIAFLYMPLVFIATVEIRPPGPFGLT